MKRSLLLFAALAALFPSAADARAGERPPSRNRQIEHSTAETPLATLAAANGAARQHPTRARFEEARHVYSYEPGALFELYTSPTFVSTILLEPGETLNDIAAGDTARWMVTQSSAETEEGGRTIVLVKPQTDNLRTNLVLITDRRTYLIEAVSHAGEIYSAQIAWSYPRGDAAPVMAALNDDYRIRTVRGRTPVWSPRRVYDDGRRTFVEFDPSVAASDMPPLFIVSAEGDELTNYRVQGQRYMLDRLFDVAELRLGAHASTIVRIERRVVTGRRPSPSPSHHGSHP